MIKIIDTRGSGKTSRLLLLAKENNGIIVCGNPYALKEKARNYGIDGIDFMSYGDFLWGRELIDSNKEIYIDEIDGLLSNLTNAKGLQEIAGYTITKEE